jgi:hypothetical protein
VKPPSFRDLLTLEADARCAVDLLMYFQRHPDVYVTSEWLAARVGYGPEKVEAAIRALANAGVIVRRRHPSLPAVLYRVVDADRWPGSGAIAYTARWRRQLYLVLRSRERGRRAAVAGARADANLERTTTLLSRMQPQPRIRA